MIKLDKYDFSFTGFSLRVNEMTKFAEAFSQGSSIEKVDAGGGNSSTGKRRLTEMKKRLSQFTHAELELFQSGNFITQKQLAFLSVCKVHSFIRDFVVEVLREKLLIFDYGCWMNVCFIS